MTTKMGIWDQFVEFFSELFNPAGFPPRWHCGRWTDFHGWFYIFSDLAVWASYMVIPYFLIRFLTSKKGVPMPNILWFFAGFIILCGLTHLIDALMFWHPIYRFNGLVRFLTACFSWATIIALFKFFPKIMALKTSDEFNTELNARKSSEIKLQEYGEALRLKNIQLVDFCNIVSHNLRAPMVNISMLVDYIEQTKDESEREDVLLKIKGVVSHLNEVFSELVESVQIKQDTEIESGKINLKKCADNTLFAFEAQIKECGAVIELDFSAAEEIIFPSKYIDSIFINLISNAIKYKCSDRNLILKIKTERKDNSVILSIADNGLGINLVLHKDNIFKIRKTFHKHPDAKGFGLFMTKTQVEAMGGNIWVESEPDKGSTFFIEFINQ